MQKPDETKQLALYSAVCAGLCILMQTAVAVKPDLYMRLVGSHDLELSGTGRVLLIGIVLLRILPLGCAAVWSYVSRTISHTKALATVILAPVLYVAGNLAGAGSRFLINAFFSREGVEKLAAFSLAQSGANLFSILGTASLVLLCCAGAVELYITTHTPSDGE